MGHFTMSWRASWQNRLSGTFEQIGSALVGITPVIFPSSRPAKALA